MDLAISNLAVWGDSLLRGVIYDDQRGRHVQLDEYALSIFAQATGLPVSNHCTFGCTVTKGKQRLLRGLAKAEADGQKIDAAILEFGGNDCDFTWPEVSADPDADHQEKTPLPLFKQTYQEMIELLLAHQIEPIVVHIHPVYSPYYFNWITRGLDQDNILRFLGDVERIYRQEERYAIAIEELAREYQCQLIDFRKAFLEHKKYYELLCSDGIHPNFEGQKMLGQVLIDYAEQTGFRNPLTTTKTTA